jgi:hypothetical protein
MEILRHRVQLPDVARGEGAQEGAHGRGCRRRHAQDLTADPPGPERVDVVDPLAPGQQRGDHRHPLHVRVRRPFHLPQANVPPEQVGQAQVPSQGGGQDQAGVGDQALRVKSECVECATMRSPDRLVRVAGRTRPALATRPLRQTGGRECATMRSPDGCSFSRLTCPSTSPELQRKASYPGRSQLRLPVERMRGASSVAVLLARPGLAPGSLALARSVTWSLPRMVDT